MKYLRRYSTQNDYIEDFLDLKSLPAYVSLVEDEDSMIGKDSQKKTVFVKTKTTDAWVGDVLCWNKSTEDWEVLHVQHTYTDEDGNTCDYTKFDSWDDNLVPDCVCVIPACHTDNGKARWLALKQPSKTYIWADNTYNVPGLTCHTLLPCVGGVYSEQENNDKYYITQHNKFYSEANVIGKSNASLCCECGFNTNYNNDNNLNYILQNGYEVMEGKLKDPFEDNILKIKFYAPNYNQALTLNLYGQTDNGSMLLKNFRLFMYSRNMSNAPNPISDLDGQKNTDILIANGIDKFPAAQAAVNYSTTYSPAGTWYLPSAGELCYLLSRWYTINQTLAILNETIPDCADSSNAYTEYWSSTLYSLSQVYSIISYYGQLEPSYKTTVNHNVWPFRQY